MTRLLVSVRGPVEAVAAARGGAAVADVEHPSSALGTPYPLNIRAVRERLDSEGFVGLPISTNIGEDQAVRSTACQAALGVAVAGADFVKCGFAGLDLRAATYLGDTLARTVKSWRPECKVYPAVFPEEEFSVSFNPLTDGPRLLESVNCDGLLVDTYRKDIGRGLLDYYDLEELRTLVHDVHSLDKEAWLAGSISQEELPRVRDTGVDVICVRGAACERNDASLRFGAVKTEIVRHLIETLNR